MNQTELPNRESETPVSKSPSNAVFWGGIVAYTEEAKSALLGVSQNTLETHSAVSEQVAMEMVEGLFQHSNAELCMSCTGYAGPSGGTAEDPVGTVYVGFRTPEKASVRRLSLPGSRNLMRARTTQAMLFMLFKYLRKQAKKETAAQESCAAG